MLVEPQVAVSRTTVVDFTCCLVTVYLYNMFSCVMVSLLKTTGTLKNLWGWMWVKIFSEWIHVLCVCLCVKGLMCSFCLSCSEGPLTVVVPSMSNGPTRLTSAPSQGIFIQGRHFQHAQLPSAIRKPVQRWDSQSEQLLVQLQICFLFFSFFFFFLAYLEIGLCDMTNLISWYKTFIVQTTIFNTTFLLFL